MTPTDLTAAIEAELPHVPAGISSGDLTEPEDRRAFAERLAAIYTRAVGSRLPDRALSVDLPAGNPEGGTTEPRNGTERLSAPRTSGTPCRVTVTKCNTWPPPRKLNRPESDEQGSDAQLDLSTRRTQHSPLDGDRWGVCDGHHVIVASNDWPPPAKGTHESDLSAARICRLAPSDTPLSAHPDPDIYLTARDWSRSL